MAATVSDLDVFRAFQGASWRGIPFDVVAFDLDGEQDHAQHKSPDRDGGQVEATGRAPFVYGFTAIFRVGVSGREDAYPAQWRKFVKACADRSAGELVHPELGALQVKCKRFKTSWSAERRDGVDMSVEFVEATDDNAVVERLGNASFLKAQARSLDDALGLMNPAPDLPDALSPSLLESFKQLTGTLDQMRLGIGNIAGAVDSYASALTDLRDQIVSADNPANVAALIAIDGMTVALYDLAETIGAKARPVTQAVVQTAGPLAAVASFFGNSLDELLALNPALGADTSVPAGAPVFVYVG